MTTPFEKELSSLRLYDSINGTEKFKGFDFIDTAGHGYLVVPVDHPQIGLAKSICDYGYKGRLAIYLEEDCEAPEFLRKIGAL